MLEKLSPEWQKRAQKLVAGYETMLHRVKGAANKAQAEQGPKLKAQIDEAKKKAISLGELTELEAEAVAKYFERDLAEAAEFMSAVKGRFEDWLLLDWEAVEDRLLDACRQVADQSVTEWQLLRQHLPLAPNTYEAGQITGIGTLVCTGCGQTMNFLQVSTIPPCPDCHQSLFERQMPESVKN